MQCVRWLYYSFLNTFAAYNVHQMKKLLIIAAAALAVAACKKENKVESDKTIIETPNDTATIDTDTVAAAAATTPQDAVTVSDAGAKAEEKAIDVKASKDMKVEYASFGDKIVTDNALTKDAMLKKYSSLKPGDTVAVKFKSNIKDVCQKKGCWMSLELPNGKESFVKFKDYGFFVPLNAAKSEAVVNGKAFVSEISVAQLKHYAKDGGKSEEEIAKITEPKRTYGFLADGVLISKK